MVMTKEDLAFIEKLKDCCGACSLATDLQNKIDLSISLMKYKIADLEFSLKMDCPNKNHVMLSGLEPYSHSSHSDACDACHAFIDFRNYLLESIISIEAGKVSECSSTVCNVLE